MNKLAVSWIYSKFIMNISFIYVYLWYFKKKKLLSICVSYDIQYNRICDTKKKKKKKKNRLTTTIKS